MDKRRIIALTAVLLVFLLLTGCAGVSRIDSFISGGEFKSHAKIIDFMLFFTMFMALSYLGLTKVWGEGFGKGGAGKGAIVGLSIALALSLAFAIVSQTQFSITTLYPLAKAIFFLIVWFLIWGLLRMPGLFGSKDGWGGGGVGAKIVTFVLSFILTYLLFCIATHMICQMSENMDDPACKSDFFNAAYVLLGRWLGIDNWAESGGGGLFGTGSLFGGDGDTGTDDGKDTSPGGGSGSDSSKTADQGTPIPPATGNISGGCRLDLEFEVGTTNVIGNAPLEEYIKKVADLKKSVYVYGFASVEGSLEKNNKLYPSRAKVIKKGLDYFGQDVTVTPKTGGITKRFGTTTIDYQPNRRVILVTDPISGEEFRPTPATGAIVGCDMPPVAPSAAAGKKNGTGVGGKTECSDGTDNDGDTFFDIDDPDCDTPEDDSEQGALGGYVDFITSWPGMLIPIILLALLGGLFFFVKKKRRITNFSEALKAKKDFITKADKILDDKKKHFEDIRRKCVPLNQGPAPQEINDFVTNLEEELSAHNFKSIHQIYSDKSYSIKKINDNGKVFKLDTRTIKNLADIMTKLRKAQPDPTAIDDQVFLQTLNTVAETIVTKNRAEIECSNFFKKQRELKTEVIHFYHEEKRTLDRLHQIVTHTFFDEESVFTEQFTRHPVPQDSDLTERTTLTYPYTIPPHISQKASSKLDAKTKNSMIEVTKQVMTLCRKLEDAIMKLEHVENRVTHRALSQEEFKKLFDEELKWYHLLRIRTDLQRQLLSEFRVCIIKPGYNGSDEPETFTADKKLDMEFHIFNGEPSFRYCIYWGSGSRGAEQEGAGDKGLELLDQNKYFHKFNSNRHLKFNCPKTFEELRNLRGDRHNAPDRLLDKAYWHRGKPNHYLVTVRVWQDRNDVKDGFVWDSVVIIVNPAPTPAQTGQQPAQQTPAADQPVGTPPVQPQPPITQEPQVTTTSSTNIPQYPQHPAAPTDGAGIGPSQRRGLPPVQPVPPYPPNVRL